MGAPLDTTTTIAMARVIARTAASHRSSPIGSFVPTKNQFALKPCIEKVSADNIHTTLSPGATAQAVPAATARPGRMSKLREDIEAAKYNPRCSRSRTALLATPVMGHPRETTVATMAPTAMPTDASAQISTPARWTVMGIVITAIRAESTVERPNIPTRAIARRREIRLARSIRLSPLRLIDARFERDFRPPRRCWEHP